MKQKAGDTATDLSAPAYLSAVPAQAGADRQEEEARPP